MIVFPVRIIMSPTSSSRLLAGRNARSATLLTNVSPPVRGRPDGLRYLPRPEPYATCTASAKPEPCPGASAAPPRPLRAGRGGRDLRGPAYAGGMFARAVPGPRHIAVLALALAGGLAGCGQ